MLVIIANDQQSIPCFCLLDAIPQVFRFSTSGNCPDPVGCSALPSWFLSASWSRAYSWMCSALRVLEEFGVAHRLLLALSIVVHNMQCFVLVSYIWSIMLFLSKCCFTWRLRPPTWVWRVLAGAGRANHVQAPWSITCLPLVVVITFVDTIDDKPKSTWNNGNNRLSLLNSWPYTCVSCHQPLLFLFCLPVTLFIPLGNVGTHW